MHRWPPVGAATKALGAEVTPIFRIPPRYTKQDVIFAKELIEAGKYRAVIDRTYPLEDVVEATRYVETEQKTRNAVLVVIPH